MRVRVEQVEYNPLESSSRFWRRVIIVGCVMLATPIALWAIVAFLRTHVEPARTPAYRPINVAAQSNNATPPPVTREPREPLPLAPPIVLRAPSSFPQGSSDNLPSPAETVSGPTPAPQRGNSSPLANETDTRNQPDLARDPFERPSPFDTPPIRQARVELPDDAMPDVVPLPRRRPQGLGTNLAQSAVPLPRPRPVPLPPDERPFLVRMFSGQR